MSPTVVPLLTLAAVLGLGVAAVVVYRRKSAEVDAATQKTSRAAESVTQASSAVEQASAAVPQIESALSSLASSADQGLAAIRGAVYVGLRTGRPECDEHTGPHPTCPGFYDYARTIGFWDTLDSQTQRQVLAARARGV